MKRVQKSVPPLKPTLPILQILALEIHSLAFLYIPNLPFKFNRDFTAIQTSQSRIKWMYLTISAVHLLFHGLLSGSLAIYYGIFYSSEKDFGWERLVVLTIIFIAFTAGVMFGVSILFIQKRIISSFNGLLKITRTLELSGKAFIRY